MKSAWKRPQGRFALIALVLCVASLLRSSRLLSVHAWTSPGPSEAEVVRSLVQRLDDNHDGRVSLDEWTRHRGSQGIFALYDLNHDQQLDATEVGYLFYRADPLLEEPERL